MTKPCCLSSRQLGSVSLRFNGHFPGEPELAGVYWNKGWWRWWWQLDYWSYKSCKAPIKSSPPTNQHPVFLQAGCPSCRPTNSVKALKGKYHIPWICLPKLTWGSFNFVFDQSIISPVNDIQLYSSLLWHCWIADRNGIRPLIILHQQSRKVLLCNTCVELAHSGVIPGKIRQLNNTWM